MLILNCSHKHESVLKSKNEFGSIQISPCNILVEIKLNRGRGAEHKAKKACTFQVDLYNTSRNAGEIGKLALNVFENFNSRNIIGATHILQYSENSKA